MQIGEFLLLVVLVAALIHIAQQGVEPAYDFCLASLAICQLQNPSRDLLANSVVSRVSKLSLNLVRPR